MGERLLEPFAQLKDIERVEVMREVVGEEVY